MLDRPPSRPGIYNLSDSESVHKYGSPHAATCPEMPLPSGLEYRKRPGGNGGIPRLVTNSKRCVALSSSRTSKSFTAKSRSSAATIFPSIRPSRSPTFSGLTIFASSANRSAPAVSIWSTRSSTRCRLVTLWSTPTARVDAALRSLDPSSGVIATSHELSPALKLRRWVRRPLPSLASSASRSRQQSQKRRSVSAVRASRRWFIHRISPARSTTPIPSPISSRSRTGSLPCRSFRVCGDIARSVGVRTDTRRSVTRLMVRIRGYFRLGSIQVESPPPND